MSTNGLSVDVDPLDSDEYDPIVHLNAIFSHPSALSSVGQTYRTLREYQDDLDDEIDRLEEQQEAANTECLERMRVSKVELAELFKRIENVKERALQTERNITEMTADIKQLDNTKKNLTLSMTALKRLQMLTTAYEQLRALIKTRQYRECAQLVQAVIQLMTYFKSYRSIDQIATLSRNVADVQRELLEQVCEDFEITFTKEEVFQKRGLLHEACLVIDSLGDAARSRLITWYCNTELRQYRHIFKGDQEAGSLDNIDRRYAWFRKTLKLYDEEHAAIFPPYWRVNEVLANIFAENTRDDFRGVLSRMARGGQPLDVKLLLSCLQQTLDFEQGLEKRFDKTSRTSIDTTTSNGENHSLSQPISVAFEPYLNLWVNVQDRELANLMPQYRLRPTKPPDEEFSNQQVISSSTELFNFYRLALAQCAKLSTAQPLLDLSNVFGKYLEQYSQQVLLLHLAERPTGATPSRVPTIEDLILVLNTADYCYNTSNSMEEKIKSRIDESFKDKIDLQSQADAFMGVASAAIRALVRSVEVSLEPSWREMRNIGWARIETAENNSSFIPPLQARLKEKSSAILEMLHKQQYARAFADNLVELLCATYLSNIVSCKPISEGGAEQMLLDTYAIRTSLLQLMPGNPPSALFIKRVNSAISRIEPLLKTIQVRPDPAEALVQAYLIHVADLSEVNFRKILELKGIKNKTEVSRLVELFNMHKLSPRYKDSLTEKSALMTPLLTITAASGSIAAAPSPAAFQNLSSAAASLSTANLPGKFDASGLGNAIMDRFTSTSNSNTPIINVTSPQDGVGIPHSTPGSNAVAGITAGIGLPGINMDGVETGAKLNENLKNIGKFFKRDMGGFGGLGSRFGSKPASPAPDADRR